MDFADTLNLTPAPAPQPVAQTNAAPSPQSGKKSEFASKLEDVTSNEAAAPATHKAQPKAVESNGSDNIVAQAATAQPAVALPTPPTKVQAPVLGNAAALNLLTQTTSDVAQPANPATTMDALLNGANGSGGQIADAGGQARTATPDPDATTQPVKAKKGTTVEATLDLPNQTATVDETALRRQTTATPATPAATAQPTAPVVATTELAIGEIVMPALTAPAAKPQPTTPVATVTAPNTNAGTTAASRPVEPTPVGFAGAIAQGPAAARFQAAANTEIHADADTTADPQQTQTTQAGRAHVAAGTPDPNLQVSTSAPSTQSDAHQLVEMAMNAVDNAAPSPSVAPQAASSAAGPATIATASGSAAAPSPAALQNAPPVVAQVYTRFIERTDGRSQRFEVRLDPAELGRVDVRIEVGADKKVHAVLAAHDSAALSDLMRGQTQLERSLRDAGIDLADRGLSFKLASDSRSGFAGQQQSGKDDANVWRGFDTVSVPVESDAPIAYSNAWRPSRLDLVA